MRITYLKRLRKYEFWNAVDLGEIFCIKTNRSILSKITGQRKVYFKLSILAIDQENEIYTVKYFDQIFKFTPHELTMFCAYKIILIDYSWFKQDHNPRASLELMKLHLSNDEVRRPQRIKKLQEKVHAQAKQNTN